MPPMLLKVTALGLLLVAGAMVVGALVAGGSGSDHTPAAAPPNYEMGADVPPTQSGAGTLATATPEPVVAAPARTGSPVLPTPTATLTLPPAEAPSPTVAAIATAPPRKPTPLPPSSAADADFSGRWRIIDTITNGAGAGQSFTFDIALRQDGNRITGGNAGMQISGNVSGAEASAQYVQASTGYTGTFVWTMTAPGEAQGIFTSSYPNSGTSTLQRLP